MSEKIYLNKMEMVSDLIRTSDNVLDVGFWGHGVTWTSPHWVHKILLQHARGVWGLDVVFDKGKLPQPSTFYYQGSAESFSTQNKFDVIFAGDLIEHLSNPGLFLSRAKEHLKEGGRLILSTPNTFNLFNIAEKVSKGEPTVNKDHTCYFNSKTITQLLQKNGWEVLQVSYLYSLEPGFEESWKKKFLNLVYAVLALFTSSYIETLVIVAGTASVSADDKVVSRI